MTTNNTQPISKLLLAGVVAGPFFIVLALVQAFLREGFDPVRHPASLLSLGDFGFVQIANFVITGGLFIACATGIKRVLTEGIGRTWVSRMFILVGIGFIMGGVFVADPALGFPPGTPEGIAQNMSVSAIIHGFAPIIGSLAMSAALIILARRSWRSGNRGAAGVSILVVVVSFILNTIPQATADWEKGIFNFVPLWIGVTLLYTYPAVYLTRWKAELNR
ncbi:MAG: DUF998 domain-containing protein [Ignavibacteriae bacterium]|nr:DUF998 domain-containing protein [Ignavibacteriota bacterium]